MVELCQNTAGGILGTGAQNLEVLELEQGNAGTDL